MPRPVNVPNPEEKTMQLQIDALNEAAQQAAVETWGLTKRYRSAVALDGCTITVPRGRISALIGHNGAGKTTLLRILCGLARPDQGSVSVLGHTPGQGDTGFLAEVGFLAQDIPLYRRLTAEDHIAVGAHVNARFDGESVRTRMRSLGIPLDRAAGKLSGGQRTQLALALTLAKRPRLLLLDEPVAALDPLARRQFLTALTEAVAGQDLTVLMSSHLVHDLEQVCDHLILISAAEVRLCGEIDDILAEHKILVAPRRDTASLAQAHKVIKTTHTPRQTTVLARLNGPVADPVWEATEPGLEELILDYLGQQPARTPLTAVGGTS
jgi:ABC-2 type transport system ATP-binding protein